MTTALHDLMTATPGLVCRDDPEPFFSDNPIERHYAAGLCTSCPLLLACGQHAIEANEAHGVWGGMDLDARRNGCGTQLGFFRHAGRGETPCPACRAAHEETVRLDRIRQLAEIHAVGGSVWGRRCTGSWGSGRVTGVGRLWRVSLQGSVRAPGGPLSGRVRRPRRPVPSIS